MTYRPVPDSRTRLATMAMVVGLHAVLVLVLSLIAIRAPEPLPTPRIETFDIELPPPPPPIEVDMEKIDPALLRAEGAASAPNLESLATPVMMPEPVIALPVVSPITASPLPNVGFQASTGASDQPGEGTGAGGSGDGTGAGEGGDGKGAGGGTRPEFIERTAITRWDLSKTARRGWPPGGRVMVVVNVQTNGRATDCEVRVSIGDPQIDTEICQLVERKARFRPARDANGEPYVKPFGYVQFRPSS